MKGKILKDWQNREKSVQELHNDSKLWISEINFINDEIRFLEHLLSATYIDCLAAGLYQKIEEIVHKLKEQKAVELQAIGAGAVNQAVKAIAIARGFVAPSGVNLVCVPAFVDISINDEKRTGIKFIISNAVL